MFEIVLYEPEIPPNTGNVMRLCANTGCRLHLVRPLGFSLRDRDLARAGMDYRAGLELAVHDDWAACRTALAALQKEARLYAVSTRAACGYSTPRFAPGDGFVFGPETRGLPDAVLEEFGPDRRLRIPMAAGNRSLNLANAVAVVTYEAWRQNGYGAGA